MTPVLAMSEELIDGVSTLRDVAVTINSGAGSSVAGEDQIPFDSVSSHPFQVVAEPLVDSSLGLASSVVVVPMEAGLVDTMEEKPASAEVRQWVSVAAGVALRFSSTDGRQQQPPVSTVSNPKVGVGQSGCGGPTVCGQQFPPCDGGQVSGGDSGSGGGNAGEVAGQSYASAVVPDRRSDVRLHFVPSVIPVDGEELCMLNFDKDELESKVCLVGHFL
ncbi:hypothetical protein Dimus_024716 [Dionaea muscipula]